MDGCAETQAGPHLEGCTRSCWELQARGPALTTEWLQAFLLRGLPEGTVTLAVSEESSFALPFSFLFFWLETGSQR